jgi:molecular chaperone HscA
LTLRVRAKELRSGVEQDIEVKPQFGLTDTAVETMLLDSITHAKADMQARSLMEAITEAEQMIQLTQNFSFKHRLLLMDDEKQNTLQAITHLEEAIQSKNKDLILALSEKLNEISTPYAERVMDIAVGEALKGKNI